MRWELIEGNGVSPRERERPIKGKLDDEKALIQISKEKNCAFYYVCNSARGPALKSEMCGFFLVIMMS